MTHTPVGVSDIIAALARLNRARVADLRAAIPGSKYSQIKVAVMGARRLNLVVRDDDGFLCLHKSGTVPDM